MSCSIFTDLSVRLTNSELTLTGYLKRYKSQDLALDLISFFLYDQKENCNQKFQV